MSPCPNESASSLDPTIYPLRRRSVDWVRPLVGGGQSLASTSTSPTAKSSQLYTILARGAGPTVVKISTVPKVLIFTPTRPPVPGWRAVLVGRTPWNRSPACTFRFPRSRKIWSPNHSRIFCASSGRTIRPTPGTSRCSATKPLHSRVGWGTTNDGGAVGSLIISSGFFTSATAAGGTPSAGGAVGGATRSSETGGPGGASATALGSGPNPGMTSGSPGKILSGFVTKGFSFQTVGLKRGLSR